MFGHSGCLRAELVVFGKVVIFEQSGCSRAKWLESGKSGCTRESG